MSRATCSCGRAEVELGCDLCAYCRYEYENRQMEREQDEWDADAAPVPLEDAT